MSQLCQCKKDRLLDILWENRPAPNEDEVNYQHQQIVQMLQKPCTCQEKGVSMPKVLIDFEHETVESTAGVDVVVQSKWFKVEPEYGLGSKNDAHEYGSTDSSAYKGILRPSGKYFGNKTEEPKPKCDHIVGVQDGDGYEVSDRLVLLSEKDSCVDDYFKYCPECGCSLQEEREAGGEKLNLKKDE